MQEEKPINKTWETGNGYISAVTAALFRLILKYKGSRAYIYMPYEQNKGKLSIHYKNIKSSLGAG